MKSKSNGVKVLSFLPDRVKVLSFVPDRAVSIDDCSPEINHDDVFTDPLRFLDEAVKA